MSKYREIEIFPGLWMQFVLPVIAKKSHYLTKIDMLNFSAEYSFLTLIPRIQLLIEQGGED
jgi:hypothetical protein